MARGTPLQFAQCTFKTKKDADAALRLIRDSVRDKEPIPPEHFDFLLAVLTRHPYWELKKGKSPIVGFYVDVAPEYQNRCFHLKRADGSWADWSWRECLTATPWARQLTAVCRVEIRDQVEAARSAYFENAETRQCEVSGATMSLHEAHTDHFDPRFDDLVKAFARNRGLTESNTEFVGLEDGSFQLRFSDRAMARDWSDYHLREATLRVVHKNVNLTRGRG